MLNESLNDFQAGLNEPLNPAGLSLHKLKSTLSYFGLVVTGQICFIGLIILYLQNQSILYSLGSFSVFLMLWACFSYRNKYVSYFGYLNWMSISFHILFFILAQMTQNHHFVLCGCGTIIILLTIHQIIKRKQVIFFKIYVYLYVSYGMAYCYSTQQLSTGWAIMIILDIYTIVAYLVLTRLLLKWNYHDEFMKWQIVCIQFPINFSLMLCLAGSIQTINWLFFTPITHVGFFITIFYFLKKKRIFTLSLPKKDQEVLFYQISESLLCDHNDYVENPRHSMKGGKPLADCVCCYSEEAKLVYSQCKHVSVCLNCGLEFLKKAIKACPHCRMESRTLFEIEKKEDIVFKLVKIYKFP